MGRSWSPVLVCFGWLPFIGMMIVLPLMCCKAVNAAQETNVTQALAAWRQRQATTKSCQYRCHAESSLAEPEVTGAEAPFAPAPPLGAANNTILLRNTVTFALSGSRIAYSRQGEHWDWGNHARKTAQTKKVYDGLRYHTSFKGEPLSMVEVDSGSLAKSMSLVDTEMTPFFLPSRVLVLLEARDYNPTRMIAQQVRVVRNGHDCVEFSVPGMGWSLCRICADPSRDYLPLEWANIQNGVVVFRTSLQYVPDQDDRWRISTIHSTAFDSSSGAATKTWSYRVTDYSVNVPLGDDVFRIEIPEGAHVREGTNLLLGGDDGGRDGWKHYVMGRDGVRIPISAEDFGRVGLVTVDLD